MTSGKNAIKIDHVAIWTANLEEMKDYYVRFFGGRANEKYVNRETLFESWFISFESGARLELMRRPGIPGNLNDREGKQHMGLIHLSFGTETMQMVRDKARELEEAGFRILRGPRKTGDGYYEIETLDPDGNRIEVAAVFSD